MSFRQGVLIAGLVALGVVKAQPKLGFDQNEVALGLQVHLILLIETFANFESTYKKCKCKSNRLSCLSI